MDAKRPNSTSVNDMAITIARGDKVEKANVNISNVILDQINIKQSN